jgi:hypothetical protein
MYIVCSFLEGCGTCFEFIQALERKARQLKFEGNVSNKDVNGSAE